MDSTLVPPTHQLQNQLLAAAGPVTQNDPMAGANSMLSGDSYYGETNYQVWDPLNLFLDGLVDFPYSYNAVQGLEANGLG